MAGRLEFKYKLISGNRHGAVMVQTPASVPGLRLPGGPGTAARPRLLSTVTDSDRAVTVTSSSSDSDSDSSFHGRSGAAAGRRSYVMVSSHVAITES